MSTSMQYDDAFTRKLVQIYSTPDVIAQRDHVLEYAAVQVGETALDVGTGPGLTTKAIGECVGENGRVIGIDISENALAIAKQRCADQTWTSFEKCDATHLLFDNDTFDVAIATQVYEYVQDIDVALNELYRVLRPGGRAVILDCDWDSCVWHTHDRDRMHRIIDRWNTHCSHPFLPRTLAEKLSGAGFEVTRRDVHTIFNPDYDQDSYSYGVIDFIESYIKGTEDELHDEIDSWVAELRQLGENGDYFFSLNRYIFVVIKPS